MIQCLLSTAILSSLILVTCSVGIVATHGGIQTACWKDSYVRKSQMTDCSHGRIFNSQCYEQCPEGHIPVGNTCEVQCPVNMEDGPGKCTGRSYSRPSYGASFSSAMRNIQLRQCELSHGAGNCEISFISVVPKCRPGYTPHLLTCHLVQIDCQGLGMVQLSPHECKKTAIVQQPRPLVTSCKKGEVFQVGVCYEQCKPGFEGVGDLCLANPPKGWFDCGVGAGSTSKNCYGNHPGQLSEIGELALDLVRKINAFKIPLIEWRRYHNTLLPITKVWIIGIRAILQKSEDIKELEEKVVEIISRGMTKDLSYQSSLRIKRTLETIARGDFEGYSVTDFARLASEVVFMSNPNDLLESNQDDRPQCSTIKI